MKSNLDVVLSQHSWEPFEKIWKLYLSTMEADEQGFILSKPIFLVSLVSTRDEGNFADLINELTSVQFKKLVEIFGVDQKSFENSIYRLNIVIDDQRSNLESVSKSLDTILGEIRTQYPKAFNKVIKINSGSGNQPDSLGWRFYLHQKLNTPAYLISQHEKVDSKSSNLKYGRYLTDQDMMQIRDTVTNWIEVSVANAFHAKIINTSVQATEKKKTIKKGFMGFFKKETKVVVIDGKYQFTDVELSVKDYADYLFMIGNYDMAYKEYKILYDEIKVNKFLVKILEKSCRLDSFNP